MGFVSNEGQWTGASRFRLGLPTGSVWVEDKALLFDLRGHGPDQPVGASSVVRFSLPVPADHPAGRVLLPGSVSWIHGDEASRWRAALPHYDAVAWEDASSGLSLDVTRGASGVVVRLDGVSHNDGVLEFGVEGAGSCTLLGDGRVRVALAQGNLVFGGPMIPNPDGDESRPPSPYRWAANPATGRLALESVARAGDGSEWDSVIFGIEWATFFAGEVSGGEPSCVALAEDGSVVIAGRTIVSDPPATQGAFDTANNGMDDIFVSRFSADGSALVFSTFIGGAGIDRPYELVITPQGSILLVGDTSSTGFPTTANAFDSSYNTLTDGFIVELSADGSTLLYGTYFGGTDSDSIRDMALTSSRTVVFAGGTRSDDLPTTPGALDTVAELVDAYVCRLDLVGGIVEMCTLLGGTGSVSAFAMALGDDGQVHVAGEANIGSVPITPGAYDPTPNGSADAFLATFDSTGTVLLSSTYFGGAAYDGVADLAIGPGGNLLLLGYGIDPTMPGTPGAFDPTPNGAYDAWLAEFDSGASSLLDLTFLGGSSWDVPMVLHVGAAGQVTIAGMTRSPNFPTTAGSIPKPFDFTDDVFVTRFHPDGTKLVYSTKLGGSGDETGNFGSSLDMAVDPLGDVVITSYSVSEDFPVTPGAFDTVFDASFSETIIARLTMLPQGVVKHGGSTPGSLGALAAGVTAIPQLGGVDFAVTCTGALPANPRGWLVISAALAHEPGQVAGVQAWIDLVATLAVVPVASDDQGYAEVELRLPDDPALAGLEAAAQFFWRDPQGPAGWSASNALGIALQP